MATSRRGDTSASTTRAGGSASSDVDAVAADDLAAVARPGSPRGRRRPPGTRRSASGHPTRWPSAPSVTPNAAVSGRSSGQDRVRGQAGEQRQPRRRSQAAPGDGGGAAEPGQPEMGDGDRMAGHGERRQQPVDERLPARSNGAISRLHAGPSVPSPAAVSSTERCRSAAPPGSGWASGTSGWIHRTPWRSSGSARSGGRADAERVDRRADVVVEPGLGQLGRAAPAAGRRLRLEDDDPVTGLGQGDRGDEPVGSGADDDRVVLGARGHGVRVGGG